MEKHWQNIALMCPPRAAGKRQKNPSKRNRGREYNLITGEVVTASKCVGDSRNSEHKLTLRALQYRLSTLKMRDPQLIFALEIPREIRIAAGSLDSA